ncbi:MAG: hypothetical protein Kow0026_12380 [Oricola sp.]
MRLAAAMPPAKKSEPTIALINVVFLMLVFFLIAGTLAPPLDRDVTLVKASDLEGREPPDALVIHADGSVTFRGETVEIANALSQAGGTQEGGATAIRLVPDRDLPAVRLVGIAGELRKAGAKRVFIVTERGVE